MKHIIDLEAGGWSLDNYFIYLEGVKEKFPVEVFEFAADSRNYDLTSHQSLHDAWLESLKISEPASGLRGEVREIQIDCQFLGPYHDSFINLRYSGVSSFSLLTPGSVEGGASKIGHGDLLMHEITISEDQMSHELIFSRGSIFRIAFTGLQHWIEPRSQPSE